MNTVQRQQLIGRLTDELFAHDQGFEFEGQDAEAQEEYDAVSEYVETTILPIILPFVRTGRIVHGDDV